MPDEPVKAIGLEAVIGLHRDQDAEATAKLEISSQAHESDDCGDDQRQVADSVAVDRPTVETIEMRWEPRERDGENNQRNENPAAGGIFAPADSETAASGKGVSDCAGQGQNNEADARPISKEGCPIAPTPNDEREKRQRPANSKSKILDGVIQKYELRLTEFFKAGYDGRREIIVRSIGRNCRIGGSPRADLSDCRACTHGTGAKQEGADDLGADSVNDLRWRVAVGDSLQLGFRPARRRDHGSRTPSEQSSTDDVVRSGWRFASPSRAVGRRPRAVAVQSFGE